MREKLTSLINVKTVVTFVCTAVYAALALSGRLGSEYVMTTTTMIVSFYFGTQHERH